MRAYLILAAILALIAVYWLGDHNGVSRERDRTTAAASVQKDKTAVKVDQQAQASSDARTNMLDYLASIPAIEVKANESAERVRTIYKTVVGRCVPVRPASVRIEIDAAYRATATAVSAMRRPSTGSASDGP